MWVTHTPNLVEFQKTIFFYPQPPTVPPSPTPGHDPGGGMKIPSDMLYIFSFEKIHKVWFKNLWNWLCNSYLMIFDLLAPLQILLNFKNMTPQTPHGTPKSDPLGMTQATKWKSCLICFIYFMCEKTHKVWFKNLWNWLCNWNLMIFNDIWPFGPSPEPQGARQNKICRCTPHSCEQLTHQIWLDFVQWFRRRYRDGRKEAIAISPTLF